MLKLVRRHGSSYLYLRGTVRGITIDESTRIHYRNLRAANEVRAKRQAELIEESIHGKRAVATFAQAAQSYIDSGGSDRGLRPIIAFFGDTRLSTIGQGEVDACARKLFPTQSASTRRRWAYTPISAVLNHSAARGWCIAFKMKRPKPPPPRERWLTTAEANRVINECSYWLRPLVIFLFYTGARCGEALWITWDKIDLDRRHVTLSNTKNGESRGVPLHARVVEALRTSNCKDGYVFRKRNGEPYRLLDEDNPTDVSAGDRIKKGFKGAVERAGITDFHPHDCRHTWATWHYQRNHDIGALQRLGGWRTLEMVMRYSHTNVEEHVHTIDRLAG